MEKSYYDVLGLCCSSEVPLIEKILRPIEGVHSISVIVPSRTVIVVHDPGLVSQQQIAKALNHAGLEADVRVKGDKNYRNKWPSPFVIACGLLLFLSFFGYIFSPLKWLALGAVTVGIFPIILKSIASLRNFRLDVNTLILIAVAGSIYLKDYVEAGAIVFLFTIAEWLESSASHKATAVMSSLMNMAPQKAVLASNGEEVNVNEVVVNTKLAVKAGDVIPIDGVVVQGRCEVDEKALTGESFPVSKQVDSIVWAGTINLNGYISINTTELAEDCVVAKMAKLVEEAQNNKCKTQRYIDECAKYYTPAVVIIAALLAIIPVAMKLHNLDKWYHLALVVLVSACPCALILSTPVATYCALSKAATTGLLVKGAEYLETLSRVKIFAFDKTGTITRGEFSVSDFRSLTDDITQDKLLYWVSSIESKSSHPMAAALIDYAQSNSVKAQPDNVEEFENFSGEGIYGKIEGKNVYVGNAKIGSRASCSTDLDSNSNHKSVEGKSMGYIFLGSSLVGVFSLSDACRTGAKEALEQLKLMGIKTAMLTGDSQSAANYAQSQLGGALETVHAQLLPQDKAKIIKDFQKIAPTAMVGDGINDAPALATSDIGISMGITGSALATETGHIILMSNDIRKLPIAVKLARKTRTTIFQNISFSIITKAAVISVALAGYPLVWLAVLADVGTCLIVIGNSMLLLRANTVSKHVHSSHDHKQSHSSHKHVKCSSDKGCCGHDGKVHELKHAVQGTEDHHGCCGHDDHVHKVNHSVHGNEEIHGHNCGHDDHVHKVNHLVHGNEETHDDHVHKINHSMHNCAHDDHVHKINHSMHGKDDCCGHDDGDVHDVKQMVQDTGSEGSCCGHGDDVHKVKHMEQVHESHGCCHHDDVVDKVEHDIQVVEMNHGSCSHGGNKAHDFKHHEVHIHLDVESQTTKKKSHSHYETDSKSSHICKGDHHHHGHVKEYITEEELGKMVKNCCRNHEVGGCCKSFRKEGCVHQQFVAGLKGEGGLSEIVIE